MTPFRLALLNLTRRKIPTIIAFLAIAISVACSGILLRLYLLSGSRFAGLAKGGDAIVGAKAGGVEILLGALNLEGDYPDFVPMKLYASLTARAGVQFEDGVKASPKYIRGTVPLVYFGKYGSFRVIGTDESFLHRPDASPTLADGAWASAPEEAVMGAEAARGSRIGDTIVAQAWTSNEPVASPTEFRLKVSGILAPTDTAWDRAVFSNLGQAQKILQASLKPDQSIWKADVLHYFLIYLEPDGLVPLKNLVNKRTVAQVVSIPAEWEKLQNWTGTGRKLGFFICGLLLLLGGLSVAAMMVTRFDAMSVQLAVLRAIGFQKGRIRNWLLWEGILLGSSACLIGALLDLSAFPMIRAALGPALPSTDQVRCSILQSAPVWAIAIAATTLSVLIPLFRLYRQDLHRSLKGM